MKYCYHSATWSISISE